MSKYPKKHGETCCHYGINLFRRTLLAIARADDRHRADADKIRKVLALLPRLYDRFRANEGY